MELVHGLYYRSVDI